jgi:hypothetical protein
MKGLAGVFCFLGILISIGVAIGAYRLTMALTGGVFSDGDTGISLLVAVVVFAISALLSWLSYLVLYGFGEIVEKICAIDAAMHPSTETNKDTKDTDEPESTEKICPSCGNTQTDGKYCARCGTKL